MRAVIALLLVTTACFPESARHRRYAKLGEGAAIVGGIALQFAANAGTCPERRPGTLEMRCEDGSLDSIGLGLIFAGLVGFAATMMTTPRDDAPDDSEAKSESGVWASPLAFCPALRAGNIPQAEGALATYVKSVGADTPLAASEVLHAWLARQSCIVVEEEADPAVPTIVIRMGETRYTIDVSASPFIVVMLGGN